VVEAAGAEEAPSLPGAEEEALWWAGAEEAPSWAEAERTVAGPWSQAVPWGAYVWGAAGFETSWLAVPPRIRPSVKACR
jgi:hypothetical protein